MIDVYQISLHVPGKLGGAALRFATLHDVAAAAGVSHAAVDRVVNAQGGVVQESVERVQEANNFLGYQRDVSAANLAGNRVYRFHFVLPDDSNDFFRVLSDALTARTRQPDMFRTRVATTRMPAFSEKALIDALDLMSLENADCICVVALDVPGVIAAIARARGLKVLTVVSDIATQARDNYVGIDNLVAGRTAGRMLGLSHGRGSGAVLPIIVVHEAQDHMERLSGIREILVAHLPAVQLLDPVKSGDAAATLHQVLTVAWRSFLQVTGVYNIGAGNDGLFDWLRSVAPDTRPVVVIHELPPASRAALETGLIDAVIDQKTYKIINQALQITRMLVDIPTASQSVPIITPEIYLRENLSPLSSSTDRNPIQ
jgi:LacI family transcriptional regulator